MLTSVKLLELDTSNYFRRKIRAIDLKEKRKYFEKLIKSEINRKVIEKVPKRTLEQMMISIPYTLKTLPIESPEAYFYYFTDEIYRSEQSKYRLLDEILTLFGRYRKGLEVIIIDRDRIPNKLWDVMIRGLGIENYPALIISSSPLGIEELSPNTTEYYPPTNFAKLERGYIADEILNDKDKLISLLTELFDAAREGIAEKTLNRVKILEALKMVGKNIKDIIVKVSSLSKY